MFLYLRLYASTETRPGQPPIDTESRVSASTIPQVSVDTITRFHGNTTFPVARQSPRHTETRLSVFLHFRLAVSTETRFYRNTTHLGHGQPSRGRGGETGPANAPEPPNHPRGWDRGGKSLHEAARGLPGPVKSETQRVERASNWDETKPVTKTHCHNLLRLPPSAQLLSRYRYAAQKENSHDTVHWRGP